MPAFPRRLLKALAVIAGIIAIGLVIAQDQETLRIESPYGAADPRYADYVAALVDSPVVHGDRYTVLSNGDDAFPAMLAAIEAARIRVSFETYIYWPGQVADRFRRALIGAAERGVDVRLVLDAVGAEDLAGEYVEALERAGVQVAWFNTLAWYSFEEVNYRTHRKILVVDGHIGFTGGIGVADHWQGRAQSPDHWRDMQVQVEGPAARLLEAAFYENWIESGRIVEPVLAEEVVGVEKGTASVVTWSSPVGGSSNMKRLYLLTMAGARESIEIVSPYFVLDSSTMWALDQAVRRGVRVRILTEGEITDAMPVKFASRAAYDELLQKNIEVYEYEPTMMHVKAVVVDGIWSIVGSANFDNRSLELNDEVAIGASDRELAGRLRQLFEEDVQRARRLSLETWRERPMTDKVREQFWSLFGEVF